MSLGLAIKRVYRFYGSSPRRWVRRNYFYLFFYVIGLYTGMLWRERPSPEALTWWFIGTLLVFIAVKWWAGVGRANVIS